MRVRRFSDGLAWMLTTGFLQMMACHRAHAAPVIDYAAARSAMVVEQIRARGVKNPAVLAAMESVPRHEFVPARERAHAYADHPLPIGYGQTISQPYVVALMTEVLAPKKTHKVLEVGTGSGYQAAVLSQIVKTVYSIEIVKPLAERAAATLKRLHYDNVHVRCGDGYLGWPEHSPFDSIIVTCAPEKVPPPLVEQLKPGGRMVIPVGSAGGDQQLILLRKVDGKVKRQRLIPVVFVPMTGEHASGRK